MFSERNKNIFPSQKLAIVQYLVSAIAHQGHLIRKACNIRKIGRSRTRKISLTQEIVAGNTVLSEKKIGLH